MQTALQAQAVQLRTALVHCKVHAQGWNIHNPIQTHLSVSTETCWWQGPGTPTNTQPKCWGVSSSFQFLVNFGGPAIGLSSPLNPILVVNVRFCVFQDACPIFQIHISIFAFHHQRPKALTLPFWNGFYTHLLKKYIIRNKTRPSPQLHGCRRAWDTQGFQHGSVTSHREFPVGDGLGNPYAENHDWWPWVQPAGRASCRTSVESRVESLGRFPTG